MIIQTEVSLYPLREEDLGRVIFDFIRDLERRGLTVEPGELSTRITGEAAVLFEALGAALTESARDGKRVLVLKATAG